MQLRRFRSLLPLPQALLALVVGCSLQTAEPEDDSSQDSGKAVSEQMVAANSTPAILQHVESVPILQQTPIQLPPADQGSEIVQTHYRPTPADPSETLEIKPLVKVEFGRAPDYGWLQGELLFSSVRGVWRLRYAAADDDDAYGGSVTLVNVDSHLALQAGQSVRVKGRLINPRSTEPSPYYHVRNLELLGGGR
jgi:hypothetical protein